MDPQTRFVDLAIQFRVKDGTDRGVSTHPYGGVWDRDACDFTGGWASTWDWRREQWTGDEPKIKTVGISEQALPLVTDFSHKVLLACGGRRSGKSFAAAQKALLLVMAFPHRKGLILSPTYRQAKNVWAHLYNIARRDWLLPGRYGLRRSDNEMHFVNGAVIAFRSADNPDAARSDGVAWGLFDERQDIGDEAANNAFLSLSEGGDDFLVTETATIKDGEFREHYDTVEANPQGRIITMRSRGNPFISHSLFDTAETFLDEAAVQRELEAQWPELVGQVYFSFISKPGGHIREAPLREDKQPLADITPEFCADRFGSPPYGDKAAGVIIGVDPPHHAVVYRVHRRNGGDDDSRLILHAVDEVVVGRDDLHADVRTLAEACKARYPRGVVIRDPHEVHHSYDTDRYFRAQGYRVSHMRRVAIESRLTAVRARMERDCWFVDPKCVHLIEALGRQTYVNGKPDKQLKSKTIPHMTVDHVLDAMGYPVVKLFPAKVDYEKLEKAA